MGLKTRLAEFDGKQTGPLVALAEELKPDAKTIARLLAIASGGNERLQVASTWVVKRWVDAGIDLSPANRVSVARCLQTARYWEVRLHLLQILSVTSIDTASAESLMPTLAQLGDDSNKLVRAWSISSMARVAGDHPHYQSQVRERIEDAEHDDAGSVRARVRKLKKLYGWLTA